MMPLKHEDAERQGSEADPSTSNHPSREVNHHGSQCPWCVGVIFGAQLLIPHFENPRSGRLFRIAHPLPPLPAPAMQLSLRKCRRYHSGDGRRGFPYRITRKPQALARNHNCSKSRVLCASNVGAGGKIVELKLNPFWRPFLRQSLLLA